ncbi:MAG: sigma-54 dependent transcriptional regulator [Proteobacteria bacterium]|nr:sigma-54 dependent transcriptional regulator [Pseudomonadota bacterium]
MNRILIVDDDPAILKVLKVRLEADGYLVTEKQNADEALFASKKEMFDMALLDYKLNGESGIELMEKLLKTNAEMPIIILTAYGTIETAVEAMKKGAYSYLTKPFDDTELILQVNHCLEKSKLAKEVKKLRRMVNDQFGFENIIGKEGKMKKVLEQVSQAASTDSTVYIEGESGTGKELIAKTLHVSSSRKNGPFIAINCGAIPENLFESELFGYEKGAFTGAAKSKKGYFSLANDGTFFLDEISEMPVSTQVKLLRVLQENEFYPLGGNTKIKLSARIIAASNTNLTEEVSKGHFREDLFYRIHVIPIKLPPLRERRESIPLLAEHFIKDFNKTMQKNIKGISSQGMTKLLNYTWPGNVRELKNVIEYSVAMSQSDFIPEDLLLTTQKFEKKDAQNESDNLKPLKEAKQDFEKEYLTQLLKLSKGNISQASKLAGKYRADFYELLKKHALKADDFRAN